MFQTLVKQAFGGKFLLERLETTAQLSLAGGFDLFDDELIVAACFIDAHAAEGEHLIAILETNGRSALSLSKKRTANLCGVVFEAEINMARRRPGEIGNLALDPEAGDALLEQCSHLAVQLGDADGALLGAFGQRIVHRRSIPVPQSATVWK